MKKTRRITLCAQTVCILNACKPPQWIYSQTKTFSETQKIKQVLIPHKSLIRHWSQITVWVCTKYQEVHRWDDVIGNCLLHYWSLIIRGNSINIGCVHANCQNFDRRHWFILHYSKKMSVRWSETDCRVPRYLF